MEMRCRAWMVAGVVLLSSGAVLAQPESDTVTKPAFAVADEQPVAVAVVAEHASIQPGGATRVAVYFDISDGWHIYGLMPGDAGLPTSVLWSAPAGVEIGPSHWPQPEDFDEPGGIKTHGYTGSLVLFSNLSYPAAPGADGSQAPALTEIPIKATVKWLACKKVCVPGSATPELILPVSSREPVLSTHAWLFEQVS